MTDPNYTAICLLVDRSGSMRKIKGATEDSIKEFVAAQAARSGRVTIRITQFDAPMDGEHFDGWYLTHCRSMEAPDVPPFELHPRGMTALHDAMARAIDEFGRELAETPDRYRPSTVIFAVMTDGMENASREEDADTVRARVEHQADAYGWQFIYLGANQDAVLTAKGLGIAAGGALTYHASDHGTRAAVQSLDSAVAAASAGGPIRFTDAQRKAARGGDAPR